MKSRPWPLVILALFQILSPAFSILVNSWLLKVSAIAFIEGMFQKPVLQILDFFLLMPLAGASIYAVKRWSYPVFLAALGWSAAMNFVEWTQHPEIFPVSLLVIAYGINIGLVAYFLVPAVRATYLDPSLRWWEAKPRYHHTFPSRYRFEGQSEGTVSQITNVSETGVFLSVAREGSIQVPHVGDEISVSFEILGRELSVQGKIVFVAPSALVWGCGIRLNHTRETRRNFKRLARALDLLGVPRQPERVATIEDLRTWMRMTISSGRGWFPQLPASHPLVWGSAKLQKLADTNEATEPTKSTDTEQSEDRRAA